MNEPAIRRPTASQRWPMTGAAWSTLVDDLAQLRIDVAGFAGSSVTDDGVVHIPAFKAARRLEVLTGVLGSAQQVHEPDRAVIGRRVTLIEESGDSVSYSLVFPGDGDPDRGRISADSPLGSAVLGRTLGERVSVIAPGGPRVVTVHSVE